MEDKPVIHVSDEALQDLKTIHGIEDKEYITSILPKINEALGLSGYSGLSGKPGYSGPNITLNLSDFSGTSGYSGYGVPVQIYGVSGSVGNSLILPDYDYTTNIGQLTLNNTIPSTSSVMFSQNTDNSIKFYSGDQIVIEIKDGKIHIDPSIAADEAASKFVEILTNNFGVTGIQKLPPKSTFNLEKFIQGSRILELETELDEQQTSDIC